VDLHSQVGVMINQEETVAPETEPELDLKQNSIDIPEPAQSKLAQLGISGTPDFRATSLITEPNNL